MSHGIMGIGKYGAVCLVGFTSFFAYLGTSFMGPYQPKYLLDRDLVEEAKKYQPAIDPNYYDKSKFKSG